MVSYMKRILLAFITLTSLVAQAQKTPVTDTEINTLNSATTIGTVSIHDPSIVYSPTNKTYYICVGGFAWSPSGTINLAWETTNDPFSLVIADRAVIGFIGDCPESVEIPYAVTNVEAYAFDHRIDASVDNIKSVVIPESVVKIGEDAFYECSNLASVTFVNEEVFVEMRPASAFFNTPYFIAFIKHLILSVKLSLQILLFVVLEGY